MAEIMIQDMEMPCRCYDCPMCYDYILCQKTGKSLCGQSLNAHYFDPCDNRPDWCPLLEVPEHGRLIDADAFLATMRPLHQEDANTACTIETVKRLIINHINAAPTVVPAEGGTECQTF